MSAISRRRPQWTAEEDVLLRRAVDKHRGKKWKKIAEGVPGRSGKQCRARWNEYLRPGIKRGDWTAEEDQLIVALCARLGTKWAEISKSLSGRTQTDIRTRWYQSLNPNKQSVQQKPAVPASANDSAAAPGDDGSANCGACTIRNDGTAPSATCTAAGRTDGDAASAAQIDTVVEEYKAGIVAVLARKKGSQNRAGTGTRMTIKKYLQSDFEAKGMTLDVDLLKLVLKHMLQTGELRTNMTGALYMLPSADLAYEKTDAREAGPTEIAIALPTGALGAGIQKDRATGMCIVTESSSGSPLSVGDTILSLNGIWLANIDYAGVDTWVKLFTVFSDGPRRVVIRRECTSLHGSNGVGKSWVHTSAAKRLKTGMDTTTEIREYLMGLHDSKQQANVPDEKRPSAEDFIPLITAWLAKEGPLCQNTIKRRIRPQIEEKGLPWDDRLFSKVLKQMVRDGDLDKKKASFKLPRPRIVNGCSMLLE